MQSDLKKLLTGLSFALVFGIVGLCIGASISLPGPDSFDSLAANPGEAIAYQNNLPPKDAVILILEKGGSVVSDPSFVEARENLVKFLRGLEENGEKLFSSIKTIGQSWADDETFVSQDKKQLFIVATTVRPVYEAPARLQQFPQKIHEWKSQFKDLSLHYMSSGILSNELFTLINNDLDRSLKYTIPITVIILLWTFRSVVAALITLFVSGICLSCSLGLSAVLSKIIGPISATAEQLVVLLVLAIGTDYSLFFISRVRKEVHRGFTYVEAIAVCKRTTGVAIFWSGITVAVSLSGLLITRDSILTSMSMVSIISVLITLTLTLVLLPPLLRIVGNRLEKWPVRLPSVNAFERGSSWILWSTNFPKSATAISSLILISLSSFCLLLKLGSTMQPLMLPKEMPSIAAYHQLQENFPDISGTNLFVIFHSPSLDDFEEEGGLQNFFDELHANKRVRGPVAIDWSQDRTTARYIYNVLGTSMDYQNQELIKAVKERYIPDLEKGKKVQAFLSGKLAYDLNQIEVYKEKTGIVLGAVLAASFVFLLIAFESIVIPIKAIILNLLSTGASFGLLVLFFQLYGWNFGVIESFVPALLFTILFGLSMDYHLFLISSIQEEVRNGLTTKEAVQVAIKNTYGVISSAAAIMASVFIVISCLELPLMKQLGLGLAAAVLLDATIIRCVLLPASIVLLGDLNWYLPNGLRQPLRAFKKVFRV